MLDRTFELQTGHWHDNAGGRGMSIVVEDALSGVTVMSLRLSAEQAYDLMRGAAQTVDGQQSPHLDRVGKTMVNDSVTYDRRVFSELPLKSRDAKLDAAVKLAKRDMPGWESYEPRHTNINGVTVVVRKWVD